jgi:hypothetical protein
MKKVIAILLIPVFLLMTAGVAITSLYCNGKISDVGITVKACCEDVDKGGCCDTKTKIVKVNDDFVTHSSAYEINKHIDFNFTSFHSTYGSEAINLTYFKIYWDKAPPSNQGDLYILFRTLLI